MGNHSKYIKLNLGCGSKVVEGWVNVDYSLGARISKIPFFRILNRKFNFFNLDWDDQIFIHNLTMKFPWEDSSVDVIYCSNMLEHLTSDQGLFFLSECYRVLKKNGIIRIVVPDLRNIVDDYMKGKILAENFVKTLGLIYKDNKHGIRKKLSYFIEFPHKCMYDNEAILRILGKIGFYAKSRDPFDSEIKDIKVIVNERRTKNAVIVEAVK